MWNISPLKVSIIVSHDNTIVMDIVFQPPQVKSYSVDMCMVCDNCNVKHFTIKGTVNLVLVRTVKNNYFSLCTN